MKKKELQVCFLGGCTFFWGKQELPLGGESSGKPLQLLLQLLYYRGPGLTRAAAIANLFQTDKQANPINNLRNTRFRLKKMLEEAGLPACEYVLVRGGRLYWNPEIPVVLDSEQFEKAVQRARREKNPEKRVPLAQAACAAFTGALLPTESTLPWVVQENLRLQELFFALVKETGDTLFGMGDYAAAAALYEQAAAVAPYDEQWAQARIRCAQCLGDHAGALELYEKMAATLLDEFGVSPSEEFRQCLDDAGDEKGFSSAIEVRDCIARGYRGGARFCHFAEFVHSCTLVSRLDARNGRATSLIWLAVLPPLNEAGDATQRKERMIGCVVDTLCDCLRGSDVFTRYGKDQYLILLPGSGNENCNRVFERINARFKENKAAYGYTLSLHIVPLAPPPAE